MKRIIQITKKMALIWVGLSVIPILYYVHLSQEARQYLLSQTSTQGKQFLSFVDDRASSVHRNIRHTVYELSHSPLLLDFARTGDETYRRYLVDQWLLTSQNSRFFYQLRYLDATGHEVIRIDYSPTESMPREVAQSNLQDKSRRDYFIYAKSLIEGEQGTFGIDLEYENGRPVVPYKPGFRLIFPIDHDSIRLGYFIANIEVMSVIKHLTENTQGLNVDFIDSNGYYLLSSKPEKLFGELIQARSQHNLPKEQPELWQKIKRTPERSGTLLNQDGLYIFKNFRTNLFATSGLTLVTLIPSSDIEKQFITKRDDIIENAFNLFIAMGFISLIIATFWETYQHNRIRRLFNDVVLDTSIPMLLTDSRHRILRANSRFCSQMNVEPHSVLNQSILELQASRLKQEAISKELRLNHHWHGYLVLCVNNTERAFNVEITPVSAQASHWRPQHYVYTFSDISEQMNQIEELREQIERDPSTSLWNKKKFHDVLTHHSRMVSRYPDQATCCLAFIDIDNFQEINEKYGSRSGDKVLNQLATQLLTIMRDTDFVARLEGDMFAIIIEHADISLSYQLMQRICRSVASWQAYNVTISIGIAVITSNPNQTFTNAEQALYRSKHKGKNCVSAHGYEQFHIVKP